MSLVRNLPTAEGEAYGKEIARMCSVELAKGLTTRQPCGTCAFRLGTVPNRCLATLGDAVKCVMEKRIFRCHEEPRVCAGWFLMSIASAETPSVKVPWPFSDGEET